MDAEGKTTTYTYGTNHLITATIDAASRLVISNLYDSLGHVTTQYTQGDTNKAWKIFWSGWQSMNKTRLAVSGYIRMTTNPASPVCGTLWQSIADILRRSKPCCNDHFTVE